MIIGNGLLAKTFFSYKIKEDIIIYASGVSDSVTSTEDDFLREKTLLEDTIMKHPNKTIVYFSSCDVDNNINTKYYLHKYNMEKIVSLKSNNYYIFRLPQVIGYGGNDNTLINFLVKQINDGIEFTCYMQTYKSLIGVDTVFSMCNYIIEKKLYKSQIINILNPNYIAVENIISTIEVFLNKKGKYKTKIVVSKPNYDTKISEILATKLHIDFNVNYLDNLLLKYYRVETI